MTYEECLDLVLAFGNLVAVDSEKCSEGNRDKRISSAIETIGDFIASMMASDGGQTRSDLKPV